MTGNDQLDATDLVETEHIHGSMPADEEGREAARQDFYRAWVAHLRGGTP